MCRVENKLVGPVVEQINYHDFSQVPEHHWSVYEGESSEEGIPIGTGTQYFVNGEKWVGRWREGRPEGHGTHYSGERWVMGMWK